MVIEEKFVTGQNIPALQAVGWEGILLLFMKYKNLTINMIHKNIYILTKIYLF